MKGSTRLRQMIGEGGVVWAAGAYDALSAKIIEEAGFSAILTTGFGISASHLGMPDAELYTMTENLAVTRNVVNAVKIPVVADIDTGYGNAINVMRTIREFEATGVAGVILEDQVIPKRCPACVPKVDVLPLPEAVAKIQAAVEARRDPDMVIVARTDTRGQEAVERAQAYLEAGADLVQPISKAFSTVEQLKHFKKRVGAPLSIQILGWLEGISPADMADIATLAFFPLVPIMTVAKALQTNLAALRAAKSTQELPLPRMDHDDFINMIGFPEVEALQFKFLPESPERKG